jgi:hypothetical protein
LHTKMSGWVCATTVLNQPSFAPGGLLDEVQKEVNALK